MDKEILWMTDIHLDHFNSKPWLLEPFYEQCIALKPHCIFITGDIGNAECTESILEGLSEEIMAPIYFVLGNHDFYGSSINGVQNKMHRVFHGHPRSDEIRYMGGEFSSVIQLAQKVYVVGGDGMADCRIGNPQFLYKKMNDHYLIDDFRDKSLEEVIEIRQKQAKRQASELILKLTEARQPCKLFVLTHIPPFVEACPESRYQINPANGWPYYVNVTLGEHLKTWCEANPEVMVEVLCGHTHLDCEYQALPNLRVRSQFAEYGHPERSMRMIPLY